MNDANKDLGDEDFPSSMFASVYGPPAHAHASYLQGPLHLSYSFHTALTGCSEIED